MTVSEAPRQLVVCGLGGQGIVFLARVIASAGLLEGLDVLTAETHGMAQRGGAVEAHLKLGPGFQSSLVRPGSADVALALDAMRIPAAGAYLKASGPCFAAAGDGQGGAAESLDVDGPARAMGHPRGRNLILLGFAAARAPSLFPHLASVEEALERLSPEALRGANREAFRRGGDLA